jgi:hypothetical protein
MPRVLQSGRHVNVASIGKKMTHLGRGMCSAAVDTMTIKTARESQFGAGARLSTSRHQRKRNAYAAKGRPSEEAAKEK